MTGETGVFIGVGIGLVLVVVAHRWDRRRHRDKLDQIQERIRRRQENQSQ